MQPRSIKLAFLLAAVLAGTAAPAYAYLDPGTGSMILQVLLGGVAGLALAGKLYWHRLLVLIGVRSDKPESGEQPTPRSER
jgi:hypothetical protein